MAKIGQPPPPPPAPQWPWGGPRSVRDKLVDRTQLERKNVRKKGDPKNPSLASASLLDFIGPAHSAEELRLPMPVLPGGHDADLSGFNDRPHLAAAGDRLAEQQALIDRSLPALRAAPDRIERLKSFLQREGLMLDLVGKVTDEMREIERLRREEKSDEVA
jgi:hypothetical protein